MNIEEFGKLNLTRLDGKISADKKQTWESIYASYLYCLCTYLPDQNTLDFHIGDKVIIVIRKYNYEKKLIYGRILSRW